MEPDQSVVATQPKSDQPTPTPEERVLTEDLDPYEDGALGDDWDFGDDY